MFQTHLRLSVIWVCVMLIYLLGDALRVYSGDFNPSQPGGGVGFNPTPGMWLLIAILMVIPIMMIYFSVTLNRPVNRWVNIGAATFFLILNLVGLPTYPGMYDKFLLVVSMAFNMLTIWYAWNWT